MAFLAWSIGRARDRLLSEPAVPANRIAPHSPGKRSPSRRAAPESAYNAAVARFAATRRPRPAALKMRRADGQPLTISVFADDYGRIALEAASFSAWLDVQGDRLHIEVTITPDDVYHTWIDLPPNGEPAPAADGRPAATS